MVTEQPIPQRLREAVVRSTDRLRPLSDAGLRARFGAPADVEITIGQVWRARWDKIVVLVFVVGVAHRQVEVVPVTIDPPVEDGTCLVVNGESTAFGVDATAWTGLWTAVPIRVLDRLIDAWDTGVVDAVVAARRGRPWVTDALVRPGREIRSELDPDVLFRAELADQVDALAGVPFLPTQEQTAQQPPTLAGLLGDRLDLGALCSALGMRQSAVMNLLRGKLPLQPVQVAVVAEATGLSVDEITATVLPLPPGLAAEAEHPRWRPMWTRRAQQFHVSEAQAQVSGSYGAFALAARQTGGGEPDWNERLRHYFQRSSNGPDGT